MKTKKNSSKGKKRTLKLYFKTMLSAKKQNKPSFTYKGKKYVGKKHKLLGMIYKSV